MRILKDQKSTGWKENEKKHGLVEAQSEVTYTLIEFPNHLDACDHPLPAANEDHWKRCIGHISDSECQSWYGAPSKPETVKRLRLGWPEGATKALNSLSMIDLPQIKSRNARHWASDGELLDPGRALLTLHPEPFRICRRAPSPIVTININIGDHCGIGAEQLKWRGAVTIKLADTLTAAGFSVGINTVSYGHGTFSNGPKNLGILMPLKDPGEPLRVSLLAGQIFTAAAWRWAHFRAMHLTEWTPVDSLGYCVDHVPKPLLGDFYIPKSVLSREAGQQYINNIVEYGSDVVHSVFTAV